MWTVCVMMPANESLMCRALQVALVHLELKALQAQELATQASSSIQSLWYAVCKLWGSG